MTTINLHRLSTRSILIFHVAAREGSFTRAAEMLHIGQSAVSHGVKQLEAQVGTRLFERHAQGVSLTEVGQRLALRVAAGFGEIQQGLQEAMAESQASRVTLMVSTSLASHWLMPRIARFKQQHPRIELHCVTQDTDHEFGRLAFDLAIPLGQIPWQGYTRWKLADEVVYPVCSPEFLQQHPQLKHPADLLGQPLIQLQERYTPRFNWRMYFHHFGLSQVDNRGESYNDYSIVVQAAMEGQGLALGWQHIVHPLVAQGKLVAPLSHPIATDKPFYVVAPDHKPLSPASEALLNWLLEEMQSSLQAH